MTYILHLTYTYLVPKVSFQVREAHVLQDLQRKLKKDKAEYEAAIQALKVSLLLFVV